MPKTTEFEDTEKVVKTVGFLPVSKGKKLFAEFYDDEEIENFAMNDSEDSLWSDGEIDFDPDDGYYSSTS